VDAIAAHLLPPHGRSSLLRGRALRRLQTSTGCQSSQLRHQADRHDNSNAFLPLRPRLNDSPTRPRHKAPAAPARPNRAHRRPYEDKTTSPRHLLPPHGRSSLLRGRAFRRLQPGTGYQSSQLRHQADRHDNSNAFLLLRLKVNGSPTRPPMPSASSSSMSPSGVVAASPVFGRSYGTGPPTLLEPPCPGQCPSWPAPLTPSLPLAASALTLEWKRFLNDHAPKRPPSQHAHPPHLDRGCHYGPPPSSPRPKLPPARSSAPTTPTKHWLSKLTAPPPSRPPRQLQRLSTPPAQAQ
jgi:hypothetical protein